MAEYDDEFDEDNEYSDVEDGNGLGVSKMSDAYSDFEEDAPANSGEYSDFEVGTVSWCTQWPAGDGCGGAAACSKCVRPAFAPC